MNDAEFLDTVELYVAFSKMNRQDKRNNINNFMTALCLLKGLVSVETIETMMREEAIADNTLQDTQKN